MDATPAGLGPEASWLRSRWGIYCGHRRSTRTVRHELSTAGAIPPNVAAVYGTLCVLSKYDSLREHLDRLPPELVQLSFAEIDRIVAGLLRRPTSIAPGGAMSVKEATFRRLAGWTPDGGSRASI